MASLIYEQKAKMLGRALAREIEKQTGMDYTTPVMDVVKKVFSYGYIQTMTERKNFKMHMRIFKDDSFKNILNQYILRNDKSEESA